MFSSFKKKTDSKVRFQKQSFKRQLEQARAYKRSLRKIPVTKKEIVLSRIGLNTIWKQILAAAVFCAAAYLIYSPSLLKINEIQITGLGPEEREKVEASIKNYLRQRPFWPRDNMLIFSSGALKNHLQDKEWSVLKVNRIDRKLPHSISVDLQQRDEKFLVESGENIFTVSNDGLVAKLLEPELASTTDAGLWKIKVLEAEMPKAGQRYFTYRQLETLSSLKKNLLESLNLEVALFELKSRTEPDLAVRTAAGFSIYFNSEFDLGETVKRLKLLVAQMSDDDTGKLHYIDMTIFDRGYVCYKNTPCSRPKAESPGPASSTPDSVQLINSVIK